LNEPANGFGSMSTMYVMISR